MESQAAALSGPDGMEPSLEAALSGANGPVVAAIAQEVQRSQQAVADVQRNMTVQMARWGAAVIFVMCGPCPMRGRMRGGHQTMLVGHAVLARLVQQRPCGQLPGACLPTTQLSTPPSPTSPPQPLADY